LTLQEPDRNPREDRHDNQTDHQRQQVTPDRPDTLGRIDASNGASRIRIAWVKRTPVQPPGWLGLLEDPAKYLI
jgi:hypothetical protein